MSTGSNTDNKTPTSIYVIAGILLIIPFIALVMLPVYNSVSPELAGLPLFYWYQTVWLAISAVLFGTAAYLLDKNRKEEY